MTAIFPGNAESMAMQKLTFLLYCTVAAAYSLTLPRAPLPVVAVRRHATALMEVRGPGSERSQHL